MKWINILFLFVSSHPVISQLYDIELLATESKNIRKVAGSYRGEQFGYVTEDGLYTIFDGKKTLHTQVVYSLNGINFPTSLVNNVKELSCNVDGRLYVTTYENHIIMFEEGKLLAGLPLQSNDLHQNYEGLVCTNFFLNDNWYVAELLENPVRFDDMFASNTYPVIQSVLNMIKPDELSVNEQELIVVTGENKQDIVYTIGTELVWHKKGEAFLPCNEIVDISSSRITFTGISGTFYQIYTVCGTGEVWVWTRKYNFNDDLKPPFAGAEWKKLDHANLNGTMVKELNHAGRNFLVGSTNGMHEGQFVYNIQKDALCLIDLPGLGRVTDFFFSPYESIAVVATGNQVYVLDIDADRCTQSTSQTEEISSNSFTIQPNPAQNQITIGLTNSNSQVYTIKIADLQGKEMISSEVRSNGSYITIETTLSPGLYIVRIIDEYNKIFSQKLIIK